MFLHRLSTTDLAVHRGDLKFLNQLGNFIIMKFTTGFVLLVSGLLAAHVTAAPSLITNNSTYLVDSEEPTLTQRQNGKVALRILPLGASIVRGGEASDQNG